MKASKIIKFISNQKNIPYSQICNEIGSLEQTLNNKLSRNNYKLTFLLELCKILGVELCIKDGDNIYVIDE